MEEAAGHELLPHWKLPTPATLFILVIAVIAAVSLCLSTMIKKRQGSCAENRHAAGKLSPDPTDMLPSHPKNTTSKQNEAMEWLRSLIRKLLGGTGSACCSGRSAEDDDRLHYDHESCESVADGQAMLGGEWDMPTPRTVAASPLWGRRILMGGRCELPRYSGLILYDEKGMPLRNNSGIQAQGNLKAAEFTTLRDLL